MTTDTRAIILQDRLIPVVRAPSPEAALGAARALLAGGIRLIEITMTVPGALKVIETLNADLGAAIVVGAGTVLDADAVAAVAATGAGLIVAPNTDAAVIAAAKRLGLAALPGAATPSEAFAALKAGADAVKLFPAEGLPPAVVRAWRAVLPPGTRLMPVGGIDVAGMAAYRAAGADGFGLGSALYRPGATAGEVGARAAAFATEWRRLAVGP